MGDNASCKIADNGAYSDIWVNDLHFRAQPREIKQFMGRTIEVDFWCELTKNQPGNAKIALHHVGSLKRTGVASKVAIGSATTQAQLQHLLDHAQLNTALTALDFKAFLLVQDANGWHAKTHLMGAAWVAMAFPPLKRYIPMGGDQVNHLITAFTQLAHLFKQK
ncbi:MAG: DUF3156 family protein [Anaerolineae bacterium]|nr:DUF3156 family protein [Anaerolineae bacterium]